MSQARTVAATGKSRAFRGLVLSFLLSFLNLAGILLTATGLNALEGWTVWQFVGLFGITEASLGLASIVLPNIWHLPVAETQTQQRTRVQLAASALLIPHWGGATRLLAGLLLVGGSAFEQGIASSVWLLAPLIVGLALIIVDLSLLAARFGVARPDLDVVHMTIRWRNRENALPGLSISASLLQFLLGITTLPAIQVLRPGVLYDGGLGPTVAAAAIALALAALLSALTFGAWSDRLRWQAVPEQQAEAEANA